MKKLLSLILVLALVACVGCTAKEEVNTEVNEETEVVTTENNEEVEVTEGNEAEAPEAEAPETEVAEAPADAE